MCSSDLLELDNTVKFTQTLDSQYERACAQYRRANKERIQALDLWTNTLESLTKRDADIQVIGQVNGNEHYSKFAAAEFCKAHNAPECIILNLVIVTGICSSNWSMPTNHGCSQP